MEQVEPLHEVRILNSTAHAGTTVRNHLLTFCPLQFYEVQVICTRPPRSWTIVHRFKHVQTLHAHVSFSFKTHDIAIAGAAFQDSA